MNLLVLSGREAFVASVKKQVTPTLLRLGLYKKLSLKDWSADLIGELYTNMKMF